MTRVYEHIDDIMPLKYGVIIGPADCGKTENSGPANIDVNLSLHNFIAVNFRSQFVSEGRHITHSAIK